MINEIFCLESENITESLANALESLTEESAREILEEDKFDKISRNTSQIIAQFSHGNTTETEDFNLKMSGNTIIYKEVWKYEEFSLFSKNYVISTYSLRN